MAKILNKKSISLIELMLTVTVLSIGIILVLRSFFSVANALNYAQNKIIALQFLDAKMGHFQETVLEEEKFPEEGFQGDARLNEKDFHWKAELFSIFSGEEELEDIKEIRLTISWKEANRYKDEKLVSYLELKR